MPSDPVELMGWKDIPSVGDDFIEVKNEVGCSHMLWASAIMLAYTMQYQELCLCRLVTYIYDVLNNGICMSFR